MIKNIIFLILVSTYSLLVWRNEIEFFVLILYSKNHWIDFLQ